MYELDDVKTFNDGSVVNVTSWIWENVDLPPIQLQSRLKFHGQFDRYVYLKVWMSWLLNVLLILEIRV